MKIIHSPQKMQEWVDQVRAQGKTVGFVPTMGYLHQGHLSLLKLVKEHTDVSVASIFVNPIQFGPNEDYDSYPRDFDRDIQLLEKLAVDTLYMPSAEVMYPSNYFTYVNVESLGEHLCGASRPGHFKGVTTVVSKLFHTVKPHVAAFGRKDAQQARIIERMTTDLQFGIKIIFGDIIREEDGLAMSSRNVRLKPEHRLQAPALYQALRQAESFYNTNQTNADELKRLVREIIEDKAPDGSEDYVELVDWETLQPVYNIQSTSLLALAIKFGDVRLIDNVLLEAK